MGFNCVEQRTITETIEIAKNVARKLIETEHPYCYRFYYSKEKKSIMAKRILKNRIDSYEGNPFLQIELEENDILAKSIEKLNLIKEKMEVF